MKSVVVTGATSFIGVHVIREFLANHWHVVAVARKNSTKLARLPVSEHLILVELDMNDIGELAGMEGVIDRLRHGKIDVFCHLAWEGARVPYRDDAALQEENVRCAVKAMETACKLGCTTFIGAGSQAEYGRCVGKIDEDYPAKPVTEYGKAKLRTYETFSAMARECGIHFIWARMFSVYGIHDHPGTLVMTALDKMRKNESVQLTLCTQSWDFVHASDVARAMYLLAGPSCENGVYNVASGESRQLRDFVLEMKEICKSTSELQFGAVPYGSEGVVSFEPMVGKLVRQTGWSGKVGFREGIGNLLEFMDEGMPGWTDVSLPRG